MSNKIDLNVIEGRRDKPRSQITNALFTISKELKNKLDESHSKLAPRGKHTLVSGNAKKTAENSLLSSSPENLS